MKDTKQTLKILFVGNSFTDDTSQYVSDIALSYGYEDICLVHLFVGACSIDMHLKNIREDSHAYYCTVDRGMGWKAYPNYSVKEAVSMCDWDIVVTMAGTGDGSKKTEAESYRNLPELMRELKALGCEGAKCVFNMTWMGESSSKHPEIVMHNGDVALMFEKISQIMRDVVAQMEEVDILSPTGTAIENATTSSYDGKFTRDGYHLDRCNGRFIAALTFFCAVTGEDPEAVGFFPHGMSDKMKKIATESAKNALAHPYSVTQSKN